MADLNKQSLEMWNAMKPMVDREIDQQTKGAVQRRKAKVTTAPSLVTKKIGVTEPFGDQYFIPYDAKVAGAKVGDVVWVEYMYGASNAFASMFAKAVEDPRFCSATLSSPGWYRVLSHDGGIPDGGIIKFRIGRNQNGECHEIDLNVPYGYTFVNEVSSVGTNFGITKIRVTSSSTITHVDVYYALSTSCTLRVDFVAAGTIVQSKIVAESLQSVADAPSGETVRKTYEFMANTDGHGSISIGSDGKAVYGDAYSYLYKRNGIVYVRAYCVTKSISSGGWRTLATVPAGFRPPLSHDFAGINNGNGTAIHARVTVGGELNVWPLANIGDGTSVILETSYITNA